MKKTDRERLDALERIKRHIEESGCHIYLVSGGPTPRFAYTIGLRASVGAELVLAGALYYEDSDDVTQILSSIHGELEKRTGRKLGTRWMSRFEVRGIGSFTLREAHVSWSRSLLLGALDYYETEDVEAYQIVPEHRFRTIDVPNMANEWSATAEPIWQWLHEPWRYPAPEDSKAMTNLDALRGAPITEACRWENDYWELFAGPGPDVSEDEARLVPLGCLPASDPSLDRVTGLKIGAGVWRNSSSEDWNDWNPRVTGPT